MDKIIDPKPDPKDDPKDDPKPDPYEEIREMWMKENRDWEYLTYQE